MDWLSVATAVEEDYEQLWNAAHVRVTTHHELVLFFLSGKKAALTAPECMVPVWLTCSWRAIE